MPSTGAPGWAANPTPAVSPSLPSSTQASRNTAPPSTPVSRQSALDETRATALLSDNTDPSPVASLDTKGRLPTPAPASAAEPEESDSVTDFGLVVALSALTLVGVAVLATLFPFGRFIAAAIGGVGLLGGLACLGAEGRAKLAGVVAAGLNFLVLFVVLVLPSWLNLDPWKVLILDDGPPGPLAFSHANQRTTLAQWVDGSSASWQFKDVRVTVLSATVGPIELIGPKGVKGPSKEQYLQLNLRVANIGVERPLDLSGWAVGKDIEQVQLTDSAGRILRLASYEEGWLPDSSPAKPNDKLYPGKEGWISESPPSKPIEKLYPSKSSDVRLIFSAPQPKFDFLRLVLPGTMFGFKEEVKFQIESGALTQTSVQKK
jgi:hypothetical protein